MIGVIHIFSVPQVIIKQVNQGETVSDNVSDRNRKMHNFFEAGV